MHGTALRNNQTNPNANLHPKTAMRMSHNKRPDEESNVIIHVCITNLGKFQSVLLAWLIYKMFVILTSKGSISHPIATYAWLNRY